mmetsp:Transcript_29199/g.113316  ORF Transcript_29199/g.113316 Transcript_29199/m.113316 type:complete len:407 (-) Transcript_29199:183-1403(-)
MLPFGGMPFEFISKEWRDHKPSHDCVSDLLNDIICFYRERGNAWPARHNAGALPRKIGQTPLEVVLPLVYDEVYEKRGGYDRVCAQGLWNEVRKAVPVFKNPPTATHILELVYRKILLPYERERDYKAFVREGNYQNRFSGNPESIINCLVCFVQPNVATPEDDVRVWGRIVRFNRITLEHECLLDDGRTVKCSIATSDVILGRNNGYGKTPIKANGEVFRYVPTEKEFIMIESPDEWRTRFTYCRKGNGGIVDRRLEIVCCACGLHQETENMLKCTNCKLLSHRVCYGIGPEVEFPSEGKGGFKCFSCDSVKAKPGTIAHDVSNAITRVRAQQRWLPLQKKLGLQPSTSQLAASGGQTRNGSSRSELPLNLNVSTVQTRAKRGQLGGDCIEQPPPSKRNPITSSS